jgi:hypothetical protein
MIIVPDNNNNTNEKSDILYHRIIQTNIIFVFVFVFLIYLKNTNKKNKK